MSRIHAPRLMVGADVYNYSRDFSYGRNSKRLTFGRMNILNSVLDTAYNTRTQDEIKRKQKIFINRKDAIDQQRGTDLEKKAPAVCPDCHDAWVG